jgi:hypothetical protein
MEEIKDESKLLLSKILKDIEQSNYNSRILNNRIFMLKVKHLESLLRGTELPVDLTRYSIKDVVDYPKKTKFESGFRLNTVSLFLKVFVVLCLIAGMLSKYLSLSTFYEFEDENRLLNKISNLIFIAVFVMFVFLAIEYKKATKKTKKAITFLEYYTYLKSLQKKI